MRSFHMMSMNTAPTAIWIQERIQGYGNTARVFLFMMAVRLRGRGGKIIVSNDKE